MTIRWIDELGVLTGEEIYRLASHLADAQAAATAALASAAMAGAEWQQVADMLAELVQARDDVLIQCARITIPLAQAQAITASPRAGGRWLRPVPGTR